MLMVIFRKEEAGLHKYLSSIIYVRFVNTFEKTYRLLVLAIATVARAKRLLFERIKRFIFYIIKNVKYRSNRTGPIFFFACDYMFTPIK